MVLTIRIRTKGFRVWNKKWKLFRKVPEYIEPYVDVIGATITRIAKELAPKFERHLSEGIQYEVERKGNRVSLIISNRVWWSHFQEYGFQPHYAPLLPYAKRWLEAHKTGAPGHTPGKRGYFYVQKHTPHIRPAIETVREQIPTLTRKGINNFLQKLGGVGA